MRTFNGSVSYLTLIAPLLWILIFDHYAFGKPSIWLAPLDRMPPQQPLGSVDYMDLFHASEHESNIWSKISVFKLYPYFTSATSDEDLKNIFIFLSRYHISLALEARVLVKIPGCDDKRGDGGQVTINIINRIHRLGGVLSFLAMDEPLQHAMNRNGNCHADIDETVNTLKTQIDQYKTLYPNLEIGDIEPVGNWSHAPNLLQETIQFVRLYKSHVGRLAFFHADVGWETQWLEPVKELHRRLLSEQVPFGVIYNGSDFATNDEQWAMQAKEHYRSLESNNTTKSPDMAIFQSWVGFPSHVLPEDNIVSLTGIVGSYVDWISSKK